MNNVSMAIAAPYGNRYLPMIKQIKEHISACYGIGFHRNYKFTDEPLELMRLTKVPSRISTRVVKPFTKIIGLPDYYSYLSNVALFDQLTYKKIAKDSSDIVFINPLLCHVAEECKKNGKIIICEAGNSEPNREYDRVSKEYSEFGIKHKYIYGDERYKNRVNRSYSIADHIVTISKLSNDTYLDANYDPSILHLIPMTGTDYPLRSVEPDINLPKAFVSLSVHNFLKGTHRLLLAWKKAGIKDIPLIIAGRLCDDMQEFVDRYGPFDNVIFAGYQQDLIKFYESYDAVGVLLSLSEGAVRVTPEMMSFGFPMITSPDASCDVVVDGLNGFIVPSLDEDAISERLRWFAEDWDRVHSMRGDALNSVSHRTIKEYSLDLGDYILSLL